jgi:hypothetical protein
MKETIVTSNENEKKDICVCLNKVKGVWVACAWSGGAI